MTKSKKTITSISELGEFGLIEHLTKNIKLTNPQSIKGVGDDAAILDYKNKQIIITTDLLTEGIHFNLAYNPLKHLGYKAVITNLSDIYAMNAFPKQILVSIALSSKFSLEAVEQIYEGIKLACDKYKVDLIGGDTTSSLTGLTISITAIGEGDKDRLVYRGGAKINNIICVSGDLGASYIGLQLLERENKIFNKDSSIQPYLEGHDYILERQIKPEARKDIIELFQKNKITPTSMIDISDGLSSELFHICKNSKVGCKIYEEKLPIHSDTADMGNEFNINPITAALNGGEDYELLFTINLDDYERIKDIQDISLIGHICDKDEGLSLITADNNQIELRAQGWNNIK